MAAGAETIRLGAAAWDSCPEAGPAGAEITSPGADTASAWADGGLACAGPEVAGLGAGAGERQAGFVSAVAGGAGLAAPDGALAPANTSDPDRAELAVPGLANPAPVSSRVMAAAASEAALSD